MKYSFLFVCLFLFYFWPHCGSLTRPTTPAVKAKSLNHWTATEVLTYTFWDIKWSLTASLPPSLAITAEASAHRREERKEVVEARCEEVFFDLSITRSWGSSEVGLIPEQEGGGSQLWSLKHTPLIISHDREHLTLYVAHSEPSINIKFPFLTGVRCCLRTLWGNTKK